MSDIQTALRRMGYRRHPSGAGIWGKPLASLLFMYSEPKESLSLIFSAADGTGPAVWEVREGVRGLDPLCLAEQELLGVYHGGWHDRFDFEHFADEVAALL